MWTPFLEHELYKYRPWSHPASCGLPRLLWPNNFGKIPRNSSKEFLKKKWAHQERGRRRTQDTGAMPWNLGEEWKKFFWCSRRNILGRHSCSRTGWQPSQMGMEEEGSEKSWLPENDETKRYTPICLNEKAFDWYIEGFENICMIQSIFMKTKQVKKKKGIGWLQKKKRKKKTHGV